MVNAGGRRSGTPAVFRGDIMTFDPIASIPATLIPGDGIGPEIVEAVIEILDALGACRT